MAKNGNTIPETLAALILKEDPPQQAIALAGEVMTLAARLADYHTSAKRTGSLEAWGELAEAYEVQLQCAAAAVAEFSRTHNGAALMQALSAIKDKLAEL